MVVVNGSNIGDMATPGSFPDVEKVPYTSTILDLYSSLIIWFTATQSSSRDSTSRGHLKRYPRSRIRCKDCRGLKKVGSLLTHFFKA